MNPERKIDSRDIIQQGISEIAKTKLSALEWIIIIIGYVPISLLMLVSLSAVIFGAYLIFIHDTPKRQIKESRSIETHINNLKLGMSFKDVLEKHPREFKIDFVDSLLAWKIVKAHGFGYAFGKMDTLDNLELEFLSDSLVRIVVMSKTVKDTAATKDHIMTLVEKKPVYSHESQSWFTILWSDDLSIFDVDFWKFPNQISQLQISLINRDVWSKIILLRESAEKLSQAERKHFLEFSDLIQNTFLNDSIIVELYGGSLASKASLIPLKSDKYLKESVFYQEISKNMNTNYKIDSLLFYYINDQLWKFRISFRSDTNWVSLFALKNSLPGTNVTTEHRKSNRNSLKSFFEDIFDSSSKFETENVLKENHTLRIDSLEIIYSLKFFEGDSWPRISYPDYLEYRDFRINQRLQTLESLRPLFASD